MLQHVAIINITQMESEVDYTQELDYLFNNLKSRLLYYLSEIINQHPLFINAQLDIDNKYFTVIDSGTTLTIFPYYLKERFISKFATYCKKNDCGINYNSGSCFNLKSGVNLEDLNNKLPTISFIFSSTDKTNKNHVQINWYPSNYITPNEINSSNYCLGISGM